MLAAIRDAEKIEVSDDELRARIMEDAELLQRDPNQLVLDVYASGRQNMMRDELVIAKTVDFLVEHATPVSPETVAGKPKAKAATSDEQPAECDRQGRPGSRQDRQEGRQEHGAQAARQDDKRRVASTPGPHTRAGRRKERIEK